MMSNITQNIKTFKLIFPHLAKAKQDATSKTFKFVPLQNFTEKSDINWFKSILEIDQQLYKKYSLCKEEITFIEERVQPME